MIDENSLKTVAAAISVVGILGSSASSFFSWQEKRSIKAKHQDAMDLAERRIAFLITWSKAQEPICTHQRFEEIKLEVSQELDYLKQNLLEFKIQPEHSTFLQWKIIQRTFLLYIPHNFGGWICHILFYILLFFIIGGVFSIPAHFKDLKWVTDTVVGLIVFIVPMIILQQLALGFQKKK